jgi:hypothetical protein
VTSSLFPCSERSSLTPSKLKLDAESGLVQPSLHAPPRTPPRATQTVLPSTYTLPKHGKGTNETQSKHEAYLLHSLPARDSSGRRPACFASKRNDEFRNQIPGNFLLRRIFGWRTTTLIPTLSRETQAPSCLSSIGRGNNLLYRGREGKDSFE